MIVFVLRVFDGNTLIKTVDHEGTCTAGIRAHPFDTFLIKCSRGHIVNKESDHLKGRRVPFFQLDIDCGIVNHFYGINIICL